MNDVNTLVDNIQCYLGQTITVFTVGGGFSGSGFTGALLSAESGVIRLAVETGMPPFCPIGNACANCSKNDCCFNGNTMGAVCIIPTGSVICVTRYSL
jgi:hypothetical protein